MTTALHSHYLIDGVPQELTPAEVLNAVCDLPCGSDEPGETVIDETVDPSIEAHDWNPRKVDEYLAKVQKCKWQLPVPFAAPVARGKVAVALIDALWRKGHFTLDDLALKASWKWNHSQVGSNAAFYSSVQAAADYVDSLGVRLASYSATRSQGASDISFRAVLSKKAENDEDEFGRTGSDKPRRLSAQPACPSTLEADSKSWLVYIPFDTSDYRLGGSLLAQSLGLGGGVSVQLSDPDYFIDCYEVVRELVEDGIVVSGTTVGFGGLMTAVNRLCAGGPGASIDISDIMRAFDETNVVRILFSEVPGVVIQIRDIDFDYLDAELLLQDVAFFPLGHPTPKSSAVRVKSAARSGIQNILESLMQKAEGED